MRRRGFTLIELLVVIAIIAILASILFPVFLAARERGRRTRCLSNLKNIGLAVYMYSQDWDEFIYPRVYNEWWGSSGCSDPATDFVTAYMPYMKNAQVFCCPDDGARGMPAASQFHIGPGGIPDRISYIYVGLDIWKTGWPPRKITDKQMYGGGYGNQGWIMRDKDWVRTDNGCLSTVHGTAPVRWDSGLGEARLQNVGSNVLLFDCSTTWRGWWDG